MKRCLLFSGFISFATLLHAQDVLQYRLQGLQGDHQLTDLLQDVENKTTARFFYLEEWLAGITVGRTDSNQTLEEVVTGALSGTNITFFQLYPHALVFVKDSRGAVIRRAILERARIREEYVEKVIIGRRQNSGKLPVRISVSVIDSTSKEFLPNVTILLNEKSNGTFADARGNFEVVVIPGRNLLVLSAMNFKSKVIDLDAYESGELSVQLARMPRTLDEVVVEGDAFQNFVQGTIGKTELSTENLKYAPSLLGESDVVKQLLLLPGVTTVGEAAAGYNVRGGSVDQNLILFDGMPVFNAAHMFGFFSAFNSELIKEGAFYKGGTPSQFGGRASSAVILKDYQRFNTLPEVIKEIIPALKYRIRKEKPTIRMDLQAPVVPKEPPLFIIDGFPTLSDELFLTLQPDDIESIQIIRSESKLRMIGLLGKNGVVIVRTNNDDLRNQLNADLEGIKGISPGTPIQPVDDISRIRGTYPVFKSTLCWMPFLKTDEQGKAAMAFYTTDDTGPVYVFAIGITQDGNVVFAGKRIIVNVSK